MNSKRFFKSSAVTIACGVVGVAALIGVEVQMALHGPYLKAFENPSHAPLQFGRHGSRLTYLVIGDSTGAGQGAPYSEGIAVQSAKHLALSHTVTMYNFSVSGAVTADVLDKQIPEISDIQPDIVLLMIGSNDVTHLTAFPKLDASLDAILQHFARLAKPPKVIVSGAGDLGACPRFAQPLRWIVGLQTDSVNRLMRRITLKNGAIWADIASKTGASFRKDPTLFYVDGFHPNARGYAVWTRSINDALNKR